MTRIVLPSSTRKSKDRIVLFMRHRKSLVLAERSTTYMTTFWYIQEAERKLNHLSSQRANELIQSAYASLEQTLQSKSRIRKSSLMLAARMAVGLSLRELTRERDEPEAA